jgi:hypothetical protein
MRKSEDDSIELKFYTGSEINGKEGGRKGSNQVSDS